MNQEYIPFSRPDIGCEEIEEVVATLQSGWLTTGERTIRFEEEFRKYTGAKYAVALNSCTAALHLSLVGLNIGPGDEVITSPLTFCATVNSILHTGARPILADVDPSGNLDPDEVRKRVTKRTRAILPIHLAGRACEMDRIWEIADRNRLHVIEDAAHAVGTHYRGKHLGCYEASRSDAVAYSFYATKNLTTGEGGMVTTNDAELASRLRILSLHGISRDAWKRYRQDGSWYYEVIEPGFKCNLTDLASAIGIHQLRKLERFIEARTKHAALYSRLLREIEEVEIPEEGVGSRHAWHLYILRLRSDKTRVSRDELIERLRLQGIGTSVHFIPISLHPAFKSLAEAECPEALKLYSRSLSLPLYPSLTDEQIVRVVSGVKEAIAGATKSVVSLQSGTVV